jgi:hypothetical protein
MEPAGPVPPNRGREQFLSTQDFVVARKKEKS